jgi:plastocyanin
MPAPDPLRSLAVVNHAEHNRGCHMGLCRHLGPALLVAALLAGCADGVDRPGDAATGPPADGVTEVVAKDNRFTPAAIQVPAGTEVTWAFDDGLVPHNVVGEGWGIRDPQRSGTFRHAFERPGSYAYACTLHQGMTGRVAVTPAS